MAHTVTPSEFNSRFPLTRTAVELTDIHYGNLKLDHDTRISGIVSGDLTIPAGVTASIDGVVRGSVVVEAGGVGYITGIVDGALQVNGAACVTGALRGRFQSSDGAVVAVTGLAEDQ